MITEGAQSDLSRDAGEAGHRYSSSRAGWRPLVLLGINNWSCLKHKDDLCDKWVRMLKRSRLNDLSNTKHLSNLKLMLGYSVVPVNTKPLYNICTMRDQRRRRWADVVQMLYKCVVFAGRRRWTNIDLTQG